MKKLTDMSNEELWALFPIELQPYNAAWPSLYLEEEARLQAALGNTIRRISHIGSTAVPGLVSKATIDILLEVRDDADTSNLTANMENMGYLYAPRPDNPRPHMMFMKGYTPEGFRGQAYHVHVRYLGDWDELYFCRYLQTHPEVAKTYGRLKETYARRFKNDRDAYTDAKTDFIRDITAMARVDFILNG